MTNYCMTGGDGQVHESDHFAGLHGDGRVCHSVVVISPEDREQVERLVGAYYGPESRYPGLRRKPAVIDEMQAALRSLVTPPRIDEPGMWGVVEASCVHEDRRITFVRGKRGWNATDGRSQPDSWDDLVDPVLIREGVTS